jgi:hypothetical protein
MRKLTSRRPLQLADLHEFCERYVPALSRHPKARSRSNGERRHMVAGTRAGDIS